jgi:phage minor structural protein
MIGDIDKSLKPKRPSLFLCKPDRTPIIKIKHIYNLKYNKQLGRINTLEFIIPPTYDDLGEKKDNPLFNLVKQRYLIQMKLDGSKEWFVITEIEDSANDKDEKHIIAKSLNYELADKKIRDYKVTSYNAQQVLNDILSETLWTTNIIETEFLNKYRSFDEVETTVLDFVFKVAEKFNALVLFDTDKQTIDLVNPDNIGTDGLTLSYGKYLKSLNHNTNSHEMVTRLYVYGKDRLSINRVNPTGSSYIEDFSYFMYPFEMDDQGNVIKSSEYMSDDLCIALINYNNLLETKQGEFDTYLSQKEAYQSDLLVKESELADLNIELATIEDSLDIAKANGDDTTSLESDRANKIDEINAKQAEIDAINSDIADVDSQIAALKSEIDPINNFTSDQLLELNRFIIEDDWVDENFDNDKELYEAAKKKLEEYKKPKANLTFDIVNFLDVVECQQDWDKLSLGDTIRVKYDRFNIDVKAKITEINFDYDSHQISLSISNIENNEKEKFISNLYKSISTSKKVDYSKVKWDDSVNKTTELEQLLNDTWDAAKRRIVAGANESVDISRRGIIVKNPNFPDDILIVQSGVLALSKDGGVNWQTAITPDGVIAERLLGRIIAGTNLTIENENGKFTFDSNGAVIDGASLTIVNGLPENQINSTSVSKWNNAESNAKAHADSKDSTLRNDLRLSAPLPTNLTLDGNGITASADGGGYARLDYRGLYISGGAIQIDGGLPDSQIKNASNWNSAKTRVDDWTYPSTTYIDGGNIYTGSISTDKLTAGGRNPNLVYGGLDDFNAFAINAVPYGSSSGYSEVIVTNTESLIGDRCLKTKNVQGASNPYKYLHPTDNTVNGWIPALPNTEYIASVYVKTGIQATQTLEFRIVARDDAQTWLADYIATTTISSTEGWKRMWVKFTTHPSTTKLSMFVRHKTTADVYSAYWDGFMIEKAEPGQTEPSAYRGGGLTVIDGGNIRTKSMMWDVGYGGTLTLGGSNNQNGRLLVLNSSGETIADLDASDGGFDKLYVGQLTSPNVTNYSNRNVTYYVKAGAGGSDSNDGLSWSSPLYSITEALRRIPKHNDGTVTIELTSQYPYNESVFIEGFSGKGTIVLDLKGATIKGKIHVKGCVNDITIQSSLTTKGTIDCNDTYAVSFVSRCPRVYFNNLILNGSSTSYGITANDGSSVTVYKTEIYNTDYCLRSTGGSTLYNYGENKGYGKVRGLYAIAGYIVGQGTAPAGAVNTQETHGGKIFATFTHDAGSATPPPPPETTESWSSTSGDNWSSDGYWGGDGVKQGNWGYGRRTGFWFFGSTPSNAVSGKTIKNMRIYVKRKSSGGYSSKVKIYLRWHTYTSKPSGAPSNVDLSTEYTTVDLGWGEGAWVTLPSSFFTHFQNGTAKGIGVYVASDSASNYAVMETSATLEITYS